MSCSYSLGPGIGGNIGPPGPNSPPPAPPSSAPTSPPPPAIVSSGPGLPFFNTGLPLPPQAGKRQEDSLNLPPPPTGTVPPAPKFPSFHGIGKVRNKRLEVSGPFPNGDPTGDGPFLPNGAVEAREAIGEFGDGPFEGPFPNGNPRATPLPDGGTEVRRDIGEDRFLSRFRNVQREESSTVAQPTATPIHPLSLLPLPTAAIIGTGPLRLAGFVPFMLEFLCSLI